MVRRTGIPEILVRRARTNNLHISTYNPGDGTKYKIFHYDWSETNHLEIPSYFDGGSMGVFLSLNEVEAFIDGFSWGAVK